MKIRYGMCLLAALLIAGAARGEGKVPPFGKAVYTVQIKQRQGAEPVEIVFQWKGNRFRHEYRVPGQSRDIWTIFDGKTAYYYDARQKTASAIKVAPSFKSLYPGAPVAFQLQKVGEEKIGGRLCDIYAGKSQGERPGVNRSWVTRKEGLLVKSETKGPYGSMVQSLKSLNLKTPPADSVFKAPAGAKAKK
ncbi:MAG: hypothetical protein IT210_04475 [Armatimonadetes bacterium]|nr:hypothetical protein [Armatimonadota bacterium]